MSDIINILPDSVANQIAAGEVVDRPASAVKELLENAMDAGATNIQLIVKDAGRTLIQVIDNGCGMSDSDARLCFERHATSKIHKADDLFAIRTMGFRGEALASIAAIAQVELKTRQAGNELGTQVEIEGSTVKDQHPCSCPVGTSLAIKNLFYNVPARRNFLKKDTIELSHIEEVFRRITLIHNDISFSFHSNGRLLYDLRADTMLQRVCQLFGDAYKDRLFPVEEESDVVSIKGYVAKAEYAKRSRSEQYLFVNGRFIKHPMLTAAIEKAYTDMIPESYHPPFFVSLSVDPSRMDVNIHPTKTEVRFVDESPMFAILRAVTKKALGQFTLASEIEFNPSTEFDFTPAPKDYMPQTPRINYNPNYNPFSSQKSGNQTNRHADNLTPSAGTHGWEDFFEEKSQMTISEQQAAGSRQIPAASDCFQIQNSYIACPTPDGLLIVDQRLAHERILFERLSSRERPLAAQQLLFPVNCQFSAADADIFEEMMGDLIHSGFAIERMKGSNVFVVSATPDELNDSELQELFDTLIRECKGAMMEKFVDRRTRLFITIARRMSVKSQKPLCQEEMQQIINDLRNCSMSTVAPGGETISTILTAEKIGQLLNA